MLRLLLLVLIALLEGCHRSPSHTIAHIPEASGVCYHRPSRSLFVVSDEGTLYQVDPNGTILRRTSLGNYDLEGVACDEHRLYLAVEGKEHILIVDPRTLALRKEIDIRRTYHGKKLLIKDKKRGIEGITLVGDTLLLSNQSFHRYPHKDPSILFTLQPPTSRKIAITHIHDTGYPDMAGLDYHEGTLWIVSDARDLLIGYDLAKGRTLRTIALPKFAQEGVAFDDRGHIFFADDDGRLLRYRTGELGL